MNLLGFSISVNQSLLSVFEPPCSLSSVWGFCFPPMRSSGFLSCAYFLSYRSYVADLWTDFLASGLPDASWSVRVEQFGLLPLVFDFRLPHYICKPLPCSFMKRLNFVHSTPRSFSVATVVTINQQQLDSSYLDCYIYLTSVLEGFLILHCHKWIATSVYTMTMDGPLNLNG